MGDSVITGTDKFASDSWFHLIKRRKTHSRKKRAINKIVNIVNSIQAKCLVLNQFLNEFWGVIKGTNESFFSRPSQKNQHFKYCCFVLFFFLRTTGLITFFVLTS